MGLLIAPSLALVHMQRGLALVMQCNTCRVRVAFVSDRTLFSQVGLFGFGVAEFGEDFGCVFAESRWRSSYTTWCVRQLRRHTCSIPRASAAGVWGYGRGSKRTDESDLTALRHITLHLLDHPSRLSLIRLKSLLHIINLSSRQPRFNEWREPIGCGAGFEAFGEGWEEGVAVYDAEGVGGEAGVVFEVW